MADGRDDRSLGGVDRSYQGLVAEGEEVLEGTAAAGDDDDVDGGVGVELGQGRDDLLGCHGALDQGVAHHETGGGPTKGGVTLNISLGVRAGSRDEADTAWQNRNGLVKGDVEEPLGLQQTLASLQLSEQLALAGGSDLGDLEGESAAA